MGANRAVLMREQVQSREAEFKPRRIGDQMHGRNTTKENEDD
jgi:hypothetical protein